MTRKTNKKIWRDLIFACPQCGWQAPKDEKKSTASWNVFKNTPCPNCNLALKIFMPLGMGDIIDREIRKGGKP